MKLTQVKLKQKFTLKLLSGTVFAIIALTTGTIIFQNCANPTMFTAMPEAAPAAVTLPSQPVGILSALTCTFNGQTVKQGASVTAYQTSTVPNGQNCVSEVRTCGASGLSGSFAFANCTPGGAVSCLIAGITVANGQSLQTYQALSVPAGQSCAQGTAMCVNGSITGSGAGYQYTTCKPSAQPSPCSYSGMIYPDGSVANFYSTSSVAYGQSCPNPMALTCKNGSWLKNSGGTFVADTVDIFPGCSAGQPANCSVNGNVVLNGQNIDFTNTLSVPYGATCPMQTRTCNNGILSGTSDYSYFFSQCQPTQANPCLLPNHAPVQPGEYITLFSTQDGYSQSQCDSASKRYQCINGSFDSSTADHPYYICDPDAHNSCNFKIGSQAQQVFAPPSFVPSAEPVPAHGALACNTYAMLQADNYINSLPNSQRCQYNWSPNNSFGANPFATHYFSNSTTSCLPIERWVTDGRGSVVPNSDYTVYPGGVNCPNSYRLHCDQVPPGCPANPPGCVPSCQDSLFGC